MQLREIKLGISGAVVLYLSLFVVPAFCLAANHHIRDGASGSTCADWGSNACDVLPAALTRGDTYYIADGTYPRYVFDDANSGTTTITIKKATIAEHGTETGWLDTYGDGQAVWQDDLGTGSFSGVLSAQTGYYVIDGVAGTGFDNNYGFKINLRATDVRGLRGIRFEAVASLNWTVQYVEINGNQATSEGADHGISWNSGAGDNTTISHCKIVGIARVPLIARAVSGITIEHTHFNRYAWVGDPTHNTLTSFSRVSAPEDGVDDVIFRYNVIKDGGCGGNTACSTGILMMDGLRWEIYGNVFYYSQTWPDDNNNGLLGTWGSGGSSIDDVKIYNNTFYNQTGGGSGRILRVGTATNIIIKNNLFLDLTDGTIFDTADTRDFNWFNNSGEPYGETNEQDGSGDPFVDKANGDFHLTAATNAGENLGAPYNTDPDGVTRGADGVWDRGAYEFGSGVARPDPAQNLRAIVR
jgi:hypothetical protein